MRFFVVCCSVKLTEKGQTREVRIFSLRGAHLIAMFARTAIAKQFRKWVLDVLDREVVTKQLEGRQAISPEQQALLHDELSQSVRDNLIWQRESRERMLGLKDRCMKSKAESSTNATAHPQRRSTSVLHLEHFRPHDDEGSFHHKGW